MKRMHSKRLWATPTLLFLCTALSLAQQKQDLWPSAQATPDAQPHQIAAMRDQAQAPGFRPEDNRMAHLEWYPAPEHPNGGCMILISGGSYNGLYDVKPVRQWKETYTALGYQCVNLVYRTPRPEGIPLYQTAWEDGQRAVRLVRSEAARRGFNPERIGTVSMSAGSHLALLLATSSRTRAYRPVDAVDSLSAHLNWAVVHAPAYVTSDAQTDGTPATRDGYGPDVTLSSVFRFDANTCPMVLLHGGQDPYSPNGSTLVYRQLRRMGIPAEVHLYPDKGHGVLGTERAIEFLRQMGFLGTPGPEEDLMERYARDDARGQHKTEPVWPEGQMPDMQPHQCVPYLEWHFPKHKTTNAIQIVYSGGSYQGNGTDGFEVAPIRRYLNEKGMTVVTLKYRTPRPEGLAKHTSAWEDLQRTIRLVRSQAAAYGLDPQRIGIMGSSAGGHLTLMGVTSSLHQAYLPIDAIDQLPCSVQWGIGIYPAYSLTDGLDGYNAAGGNEDSAALAPEFSFDLNTAPMLLIHGDADPYAAMASVKVWEKQRSMGIQSELHTLATRKHCFQDTASPGTGSYTWMDRVWEFLTAKGFNR